VKNLNNKLDILAKSLENVGNSLNKSIEEASKKALSFDLPTPIWEDFHYNLPELEINPMIGLAEEQLSEIKKLNSQIETLQKRIQDLEEKAELSRKNQWKHDVLIAFIGAFFGFIFSLFI